MNGATRVRINRKKEARVKPLYDCINKLRINSAVRSLRRRKYDVFASLSERKTECACLRWQSDDKESWAIRHRKGGEGEGRVRYVTRILEWISSSELSLYYDLSSLREETWIYKKRLLCGVYGGRRGACGTRWRRWTARIEPQSPLTHASDTQEANGNTTPAWCWQCLHTHTHTSECDPLERYSSRYDDDTAARRVGVCWQVTVRVCVECRASDELYKERCKETIRNHQKGKKKRCE